MADDLRFGQLLRALRKRAGLTRQQLARGADLSVSAIASYETGRRLPDAAQVDRLRPHLGLTPEEHADLRASAGLRRPDTGLKAAWYKARGAPNTAWDEVQGCDWVTLVINERKEIVAWNGLANLVAERDLASMTQPERSVLRMAATEHFARHLTNWPELIGRLISVMKAEGGDLEQPSTPFYAQAVLEDIGLKDPRFLPTIFDLYLTAPTWREEWRNVHRITWRLDDGTELAFHGAFADWSNYDGLWAFDWHAADAATARWVQSSLAAEARDVTPPQAAPFAEVISAARALAGLSRAQLAARSGVTAASVAAYEHATRSPSRGPLVGLCRALTIDGYTTNRLLREAGFDEEPSDWARWLAGEQPVSVMKGHSPLTSTPQAAIFATSDTLQWPSLVLDGGCHVIHANPLARRLVDLGHWKALPGRPGPHLMQLMVSREFRERLVNWEMVAAVILPGRLEAQLVGAPGPQSRAGVRAVAEALRKTESEGLRRLIEVWEHSADFESLRRPGVHFEWRSDEGEALAFNCVGTNMNAYDPYKAMDLFPADEATFAWMARA